MKAGGAHTILDGARLAPVQAAYDRGRYLEAHEAARALGPYRSWRGTGARVLAGRLAHKLGAPRLAAALHYRAFRDDPDDLEARYFYASSCVIQKSPLSLWEFLRDSELSPDGGDVRVSHLLALGAQALAVLRDFERAHAELERAEAMTPQDPWIGTSRSHVLELEDRMDEAVGAAEDARQLQPWFHPAVLQQASALAESGRLADAIDLLEEADGWLQSYGLRLLSGHLHSEAGNHVRALRCFGSVADLAPLWEHRLRAHVAGRKAASAYLAGDLGAAVRHARKAEGPYFERMAKLPAAGPAPGTRRELAMGFVRQHHMTCGPATLASIARYLGEDVDQAELAAEIGYGGTHDHGERDWAERRGFVTRELTVTREAAHALIDRGLPFALTTLEPTSGHLQAVYGYDTSLDTLLVRDPSSRHFVEYPCDELLKKQASSGPRGMVFVPRSRAGLLEGLELPEADLHDALHRLKRALVAHHRQAAVEQLEALRRHDGAHRITLEAELELARYDGDRGRQLVCCERLLEAYPDDPRLAYAKLQSLRDVSDRAKLLQLARQWATSPKRGVPAFYSAYAEEIRRDARRRREARFYLRKAMRDQPTQALYLHQLADVLWGAGELSRALALFRFAACISEVDEHMASEYFRAARFLKQTDAALSFLERRAQRLRDRSGAAPSTFFAACEDLSREQEGFAELERALERRPDDGALQLYCAETQARYGRLGQAQSLLQRARDHSHPVDWLKASAHIARFGDGPEGVEALWREVLGHRPLDLEAHRELARCLEEQRGPEAAFEHLRAAVERFPHHFGLACALAQALATHGHPGADAAMAHMIATAPEDAWAHREQAVYRLQCGDLEGAAESLAQARVLDDTAPALHAIEGQLEVERGRPSQARRAFERAVELDVDHTYAIAGLLDACETLEQRKQALLRVKDELVRQTTYGGGLLEFGRHARAFLGRQQALAVMREAHAARPDLPPAWLALARELSFEGALDEARSTIERAVSRFPLHVDLWLELSTLCELDGDPAAQRAALQQALAVAPRQTDAGRRLAILLGREGKHQEAIALLRRMAAKEPLEPRNHGVLADALWNAGEREGALHHVRRALVIAPGYDWAWNALVRYAGELEQPELPRQLARELTEHKPGEAGSWLVLARICADDANPTECLAALDHAIAVGPRLEEAHDLKAELLAQHGRFQEALSATEPAAWNGPLPAALRGRRCWIHAVRGDLSRAIREMRAVVGAHPDYRWGWRSLADWCEAQGDVQGNLEASRALLRLEPHTGAAHGYLASALLAAGERDEARRRFERSLELEPSYAYGAANLFDLSLDSSDLQAAAAALERLGSAAAGEEVQARVVELAAARGQRGEAVEAFGKLSRLPASDRSLHERAARALDRAGWTADAERLLEACLVDPQAEPGAGLVWVSRNLDRWRRALGAALGRPLGPAGVEMVADLIETAAERGRTGGWHPWTLWHRRALRRHTRIWGAVGFALTRTSVLRCQRWLRDWPERGDVVPWMLNNLALCYERLDDFAEALRVREAALTRPADHSETTHLRRAAFDHAVAGDRQRARALLERARERPLQDGDETLAALTALVLRARDSDSSPERLRILTDVRRRRRVASADLTAQDLIPDLDAAARKVGSLLPWWRRALVWLSSG